LLGDSSSELWAEEKSFSPIFFFLFFFSWRSSSKKTGSFSLFFLGVSYFGLLFSSPLDLCPVKTLGTTSSSSPWDETDLEGFVGSFLGDFSNS
jgi:hypothetical protein